MTWDAMTSAPWLAYLYGPGFAILLGVAAAALCRALGAGRGSWDDDGADRPGEG